MYSNPVDLSFSYLRSAVEASLDIKKDQVHPNNPCLSLLFLDPGWVKIRIRDPG
jgi:hypothetical protein